MIELPVKASDESLAPEMMFATSGTTAITTRKRAPMRVILERTFVI